MRVVGRAVLPGLAPYPGSDKAGLGVGALLTEGGWKRFSSDYQKTEYIFRWAPGKSLATLTAAFQHDDPSELPLTIDPSQPPGRGDERRPPAGDPHRARRPAGGSARGGGRQRAGGGGAAPAP